jgi:hypothetical protein
MELKKVKSKSGNVVSAGRDEKTGLVTIHFRGKKPDDAPIPYKSSKPFSEKEWSDFAATFDSEDNSTGSYFHSNFRTTKDFKKL